MNINAYVNMKIVNQDDDKSCMLACVAMISDKTLTEIRSLYKGNIPLSDRELFDLVESLELAIYSERYNEIHRNSVYIIVVPSLNITGGTHGIVVDTRGGEMRVFDPQHGRKGKKWYTTDNLKS